MQDTDFRDRFIELFKPNGNRRHDLTPGGWWETPLFALSWMPPHNAPSLLIRNTTNPNFGPYRPEHPDARITFRHRCLLAALSNTETTTP